VVFRRVDGGTKTIYDANPPRHRPWPSVPSSSPASITKTTLAAPPERYEIAGHMDKPDLRWCLSAAALTCRLVTTGSVGRRMR
jgi:hypothetical protein